MKARYKMSFEIIVASNTPLTPLSNLEEATAIFLDHIGYFPKGHDPKADPKSLRKSIPFRLFVDCFLRRMDRGWLVEELAAKLKTSKPTVYRHLNKLKSLDILESVDAEDEETGQTKKAYRIRYSDLSKAWSFTEANVEMAMESYRKTVNHIQKLAEDE